MKLSLLFTITIVASFTFTPPKPSNGELTTGCHNHYALIDNTVDLVPSQYQGTWYEQIRSSKIPFEKQCYCTKANYALNDDGSIKVKNTCKTGTMKSSSISSVVGKAVIPNKSRPGYLKVSFGIPFVKAPYAVLDTDYDNYSIVASCTIFNQNGYVWVLTRQQNPDVELIETLKNKTASMGFDTTDLIYSYQGPKCNEQFFTLLNVNNNYTNDDCCLDGNCCHGVEYCCDECYGSCRCSVGGKCH